MICFFCGHNACAKIGEAQGNIWKALFGRRSWLKDEKYVCRECYELIKNKVNIEMKDSESEIEIATLKEIDLIRAYQESMNRSIDRFINHLQTIIDKL